MAIRSFLAVRSKLLAQFFESIAIARGRGIQGHAGCCANLLECQSAPDPHGHDFPLFHGLTHYVNPALERYAAATPISVAATDCAFHIFILPTTHFSDCDTPQGFTGGDFSSVIVFVASPGAHG